VRSVLDHVHGAARWRADQLTHTWVQAPYDEVHGSTWTIVGFGSIGREIASRARAFGVTVRGVRRTPGSDGEVDAMFTPELLPDALSGASVVVLAAPLTKETANIADERFFAAMEPGSLLVNIGRGGLVDEDALRRGLDAGRPGAATLDVMATEPLPPGHWLWDHPKVVLTPHVAGSSTGNGDRLADLFCRNLGRYLAGEPLLHEERLPAD
jgi:phosphoglycerate dehydrogenase-like enzyme